MLNEHYLLQDVLTCIDLSFCSINLSWYSYSSNYFLSPPLAVYLFSFHWPEMGRRLLTNDYGNVTVQRWSCAVNYLVILLVTTLLHPHFTWSATQRVKWWFAMLSSDGIASIGINVMSVIMIVWVYGGWWCVDEDCCKVVIEGWRGCVVLGFWVYVELNVNMLCCLVLYFIWLCLCSYLIVLYRIWAKFMMSRIHVYFYQI